MSRIPHEILTKGSSLTREERSAMQAHTWLGALSIFELRDLGDVPFQSMIVAYEHHMKVDGTGYPGVVRPREMSVLSKIVAVVSAFDAATNKQAYASARPADQVLQEFQRNEGLGFDPVMVKALINLLGVYPVGSCVILDTYELGIVHAAQSDPSLTHRPVVRLLIDADGNRVERPPLVDLSETDEEGAFVRTITTLTDPEKHGVNVSEYLS